MAEEKRTRWEIWVVTAVVMAGLAAIGLYVGLRPRSSEPPTSGEAVETATTAPSGEVTGGTDATGTGEQSAHRGSVDEATRREVIAALRESGVAPVQETELLIRRDQSVPGRDAVIAEGAFRTQAGGETRGVYELTREGDTWRVRTQR